MGTALPPGPSRCPLGHRPPCGPRRHARPTACPDYPPPRGVRDPYNLFASVQTTLLACRRGFHRLAVEDRVARCSSAPSQSHLSLARTQHGHRLWPDAALLPPPPVVIDRVPRREVVRQGTPTAPFTQAVKNGLHHPVLGGWNGHRADQAARRTSRSSAPACRSNHSGSSRGQAASTSPNRPHFNSTAFNHRLSGPTRDFPYNNHY